VAWNDELVAASRTQMLPTGDVGDWCAEIHQVWRSLRKSWKTAAELYKKEMNEIAF